MMMMRNMVMWILVALLLSAGSSETRPLSPTMVRVMRMKKMLLEGSKKNLEDDEDGGQHDMQRLSPGGPDVHHH